MPDEYINKFNLPIYYLTDKQPLAEHIKTDLELISKRENAINEEKTLYDIVFNSSSLYGKKTIPLWSQYYTSNKDFIKDSQRLIKGVKEDVINKTKQEEVDVIWQEIKTETGFIEKYHYMDWKRFKGFNNSSSFLQILSLYNMTSPLISLTIPIFFLIFPFVILKIQGIPISLSKYIEILKMLFKQHQLGQIFTIGTASWDKMIYIVASFGFYILQVYQNINSCVKYYYNMKKIHLQLFNMSEYAKHSLENMELLLKLGTDLKTYQPFFSTMSEHKTVLEHMVSEFDQVIPNCVSFKKFKQIGHVMKCFYQLYNKAEYHQTLEYSFGLNGYLDNLIGLAQRYKKQQINSCKINPSKLNPGKINPNSKINHGKRNKKPTKFTDAYFPTLVDTSPVKNSYKLDKHIIVTGPNAAGKTTLLKTTIFNVILSQQIGFGFYKSANIILYDHIHCYINIPDTSGRDSLFQAEARRCKEIIASISEASISEASISEASISEASISEASISEASISEASISEASISKQHLCVFDELYSGTNPYEAIGSAYAFLSYLNKFDNVNFVLTTHFLDLCKRLESQSGIKNFHMEVQENGDDFKYTYKMKTDISTVKGGVKVLRDLDYPLEIINNTIAVIKGIIL
jgi:hypothetical protein